ncbi:MAG: DNRLRE domain-containing protein [Candidatus Bathyarchaeia archaeon]
MRSVRGLLIALLLFTAILGQNLTLAAGLEYVTLYPVADNYADSKYPQLGTYGHVPVLYVGNSYDHVQDLWGSERIYIRFDISSLPKGIVIQNASLRLWQFFAPASPQEYEVHRVLGDWKEGTENWNNQPAWDSTTTSTAVAPDRTEVAVEWDITRDVQAWLSGQAKNYGIMVKVAKEERVKDASSGFWSREYPVGSHEEWRPALIISVQTPTSLAYTVSVSVAGLPGTLATTVAADGQPYKSITVGNDTVITFDRGTIHTIEVADLVTGAPNVRYVCDLHEVSASNTTSHMFTYATEYYVNVTTEPKDFFETSTLGWYRSGAVFSVERTGPDVINTTQGTRMVFDAWYVNGQKTNSELRTIVVDEPLILKGLYRTEYFLNVTSPFGTTSGSGWYPKDSAASFSIDRTVVPTSGVLGVLGLRKAFIGWSGSQDFLGLPEEAHGSVIMRGPTTVTATWGEDWSNAQSTVLVLVLVAAVVVALGFARSRQALRCRHDKGKIPQSIGDKRD